MTQSDSLRSFGLYIDGAWVAASDAASETLYNPATGEPIAQVARATIHDIDRAVEAARKSFDIGSWAQMRPVDRAKTLEAIADLLEENTDELAELETLNGGATLRKSSWLDIPVGIEHLRYFADLARQHPMQTLPYIDFPSPSANAVWREPIGVCGQIIPWNYPFLMAIWKIGPALAAGNSLVLKPASLTPVTALRMAELIHEADLLPHGVFNVVTGPGGLVGERLTSHPAVDKIAFTGSTEVGRRIAEVAGRNLKRVTLELGGKSPVVVLPNADLDLAVDGAIWAAFMHSGQSCEAGTRLLLPDSLHDQFVERMVARVEQLVLGDPLELTTDLGPLVSAAQKRAVEAYIELGIQEGATLRCGGVGIDDPNLANGHFVRPTIFTDVHNQMRIAQEEIFGPVLSVIRYHTVGEAITIANDTNYGLAASVWSRDLQDAQEVARAIRAGTVWINDHHLINAKAPFGGYKDSGIGRELGPNALDAYSEIKHIHTDLTQERTRRIWVDIVTPRLDD
ncbi:MAG: aldehyde dehydrogenase family protein [Chloroflexi bacterium]|nr:aldehyde dehydrogenase family protein [Chloroflexota bacterium]